MIRPKEAVAAVQAFANLVIVQWGWRRLLLAALAGALSALAFAPFYVVPVLWLTVPVFVWLIDGAEAPDGAGWPRRLLPAALTGFAFGFGFFVAGLWWIGAAFLVDAGNFAWALPIAVLALPAALALFWAFGAALARLFWTEGWPRLLIFAVAFALAEWLRGHLFTGFPWNAFGYALTPVAPLMQSAALVGIWGLTPIAFFIFAAPAILADAAPWRLKQGVLGWAVFLLAAHAAFGFGRLAGGPDAVVPDVHLRIIQPVIPEDEHWQVERGGEILRRYLDLSRNHGVAMTGITHLVWPESAFPYILTDRPDALAAIADLLPPGATLITGAARAERATDAAPPLVFNALYVIDDSGIIRAAYDKVHLVPFGEYLPFRSLLESLGVRQLIALPGGFSPGQRLRTLTAPGAPPFGPLICYEVIFPGAVTEPGNRPSWLVNLTNDGWYGRTPGPYQHLLQARVRAVEEGLPLVRAANSGISAIVDPHGRLVASLGLDRQGVVDGDLPAALPPTPYARFGDLGFWIVLVACAALGLRGKFTY